ncbi:hypothetical protein [Paenibacillus sp. GYB003]|uniref:hypothetical protein n=1 Tax=Paenibacillus sp. GYB003 TaxID=2994392 RepID=UPI002F968143
MEAVAEQLTRFAAKGGMPGIQYDDDWLSSIENANTMQAESDIAIRHFGTNGGRLC